MAKLAYIQLLDGKGTAEAATASRTTTKVLQASRGKVTDTNGIVLAQSVERYTIIGNPKFAASFEPTTCTAKTTSNCHSIDGKPVGATGPAAVARLLAPILGMDALQLGAMLTGTNQYVVIKKDVVPSVKRSIDKLNLGGIISSELSSERTYPNGTLMGSLLGGVDTDDNGVSGIEKMENSALTGVNGYQIYQRGANGQQIPGTETESKDAVDGSTVKLSLDRDVQWYVEKALKEGQEKYKAKWAIAVVQRVSDAKILALAGTDQVQAGSAQAKMNPSLAVTETFEPGSVGKIISLAGMLQEGTHNITDEFSVPYSINVEGQQYHDSESHGTERWTLAGILQNSSNVGMVMAGDQYTTAQRYGYLTKFGIGQPSGMGLTGESQGLLSSSDKWDKRTRNTVLFGQGYATNALQITNAVATIANKGVKQQQSIIDSVTSADGKVTKPKTSSEQVVNSTVSAEVLNAMESVAENYKSVASVDGYRVAAKTGTAEVAGSSGGLTSIVADWVGVLPADNPQYVVTVVMKDPQGTYGGLTAGPVFANIGEFLMQKYEVPTSTPRNDAIPVNW
ncbi:MAG: penicillin-binding protein 2 [Bifidobacterium crudilactis]|nr:penicillin-binding protein 2 [Bifidobacterium crudilactis]MCI1867511.1 penicillin-binding protein 2 [Bifidobacterium crudilactis]MDN5972836.1 penicillin-binding protein 2 [Bifidobacterium crudilactis]MDN6000133.1 penicillin-binding protein 2 [Bifidobacterium crudilactis]MDN6209006.1 penicillin-binding protein 2 [Bifidobacterium crudilactis]MDN6467233.1 penicillin-binding protein 2 [Bifidobacterium crudilactis]